MSTYLKIPQPVELTVSDAVKLLCVFPKGTEPDGVTMLDNIAKACGLTPEAQAKRLPLGSGMHALAAALPGTNVPFCVVYGLTPKQVGAQWMVQPYTWIRDGDVQWCFAERPEVINADQARKRQLWSCLKRVKDTVEG